MEVISYNNPIIITSEDEDDDDDVVLVKEEKVVQDAGANDDVIFVSEESSPFLRKSKSENCQKNNKNVLGRSNSSAVDINGGFNISQVNVNIFNSSLLSLGSLLQPLDSTESVLLGTDASSASTETKATLIETIQASSSPAPRQEVNAGIYSGSSQNKLPECSEKSSISSAFQEDSLLPTSAKTPSDSSAVIQGIDIGNLCMDSPIIFCSDVLQSPSDDSAELVKAETAMSSQSQQSTSPVMTDPGERGLVPGTSNCGSDSDFHCSSSALEDLKLCIPEKTTSSNNSDSPLPLDMDVFNTEDLINLFNFFDNPHSKKEQKISDKDVNAPGDSDVKGDKISKTVGSADVRNRIFSLIKPPAITESPSSSKSTSQDHCAVTKCDERMTYNVGCLSSDGIILDCFHKLTHRSSVVSSVNTNKLAMSPNKLSTTKGNHSNHGSSLINTDTNSGLQSKSFSSGHGPALIPNLLKSHPYRQKAVWNCLAQTRKNNLNYCKKRSNSLVQALLHKISCKSVSQDLDTKAPIPGAAHWKIVSSETSQRKRANSDNRNHEHPKRKQLSETAEEKPNLKIKLKMISPSSSSVTDSKLSTAYSQCSIGVTKREFSRGESLNTKTLAQPAVHRSVSESNMKAGQEERDIQMLCAACCKTVSNKTLAKCCKGHDICATCLEPQVKVILTGDVKQKYVKCPTGMCTEALSFDELRKTLPSFVVDILEKKLDKEYLSYITKWMFTDEQLKTRSEFASLDTKITPAPTLSMRKYEEIYSQESCDVAADLPAFWAPMEHGAPVMAFEVVPDTEEYRALACQFYETCPFGDYDIARIIRVQNPILWKYFALKQSEMIQENDGMDVVVKQLYHGTHHSTLEAIARKGFDWRLSGKHGTVYGNGSYFARTANYSHSYTDCAGTGVSVKAGSRSSYMYQPGPSSSSSSSLNHYSLSSLRQSSLWSTFPTLQSLSSPVLLCSSQRQSPQSALPRDSNTSHRQAPYSQAQPNQPAVKDAACGVAPATFRKASLDAFLGGLSMIYLGNDSLSNVSPTAASPQNQSSQFSSCIRNATPASNVSEHLQAAALPALSLWDSLEDSLKDKTDVRIKSDQVGHTASCSGSTTAPQRREKGTANLTAAFARSPNSKTHFMFMAKVLVGRHTGGKSGLKRPPPLDESNPYGKCYDSCVDNIFSPQVYVIFDSNQAYPEYVIEYNSLKS